MGLRTHLWMRNYCRAKIGSGECLEARFSRETQGFGTQLCPTSEAGLSLVACLWKPPSLQAEVDSFPLTVPSVCGQAGFASAQLLLGPGFLEESQQAPDFSASPKGTCPNLYSLWASW